MVVGPEVLSREIRLGPYMDQSCWTGNAPWRSILGVYRVERKHLDPDNSQSLPVGLVEKGHSLEENMLLESET
jgi:hypothetical protein